MKPLKALLAWIGHNPARVAAIATVVLSWLASAGVPATIVGGLGTILAAGLGVGLHSVVTPVTTLVSAVNDAATQSAAAVAQGLGGDAAGAVGTLTAAGTKVATTAASDVAGAVLKGLGVSRHALPSTPVGK